MRACAAFAIRLRRHRAFRSYAPFAEKREGGISTSIPHALFCNFISQTLQHSLCRILIYIYPHRNIVITILTW